MDQAATNLGSTDVYGQVGDHIASVIRAAEVAVAELRETAEREAEELKSSATVSARETLEDAHRQADELLAGAREIRERAESDAQLRRAEADTYAVQRQRDADAQTSKMIEAAQQAAARTVEDARMREAGHREAVAQTEQRLVDLAQGLRDLADRLDHLHREPDVERALADALKTATGPSTDDAGT